MLPETAGATQVLIPRSVIDPCWLNPSVPARPERVPTAPQISEGGQPGLWQREVDVIGADFGGDQFVEAPVEVVDEGFVDEGHSVETAYLGLGEVVDFGWVRAAVVEFQIGYRSAA